MTEQKVTHLINDINNGGDQIYHVSWQKIIHIMIISFVVIHLIYFVLMLFLHKKIKRRIKLNQSDKPFTLRKINEICAICLETISNEVQMMCSHSFCAKCILTYEKNINQHALSMDCPMCRQESKGMFPKFERTEDNKEFYDSILSFNIDAYAINSSFCFLVDIIQYGYGFITCHPITRSRKWVIVNICLVGIAIIYQLMVNFSSLWYFIEHIVLSVFLLLFFVEVFYRSRGNRGNANVDNSPHENIQ